MRRSDRQAIARGEFDRSLLPAGVLTLPCCCSHENGDFVSVPHRPCGAWAWLPRWCGGANSLSVMWSGSLPPPGAPPPLLTRCIRQNRQTIQIGYLRISCIPEVQPRTRGAGAERRDGKTPDATSTRPPTPLASLWCPITIADSSLRTSFAKPVMTLGHNHVGLASDAVPL